MKRKFTFLMTAFLLLFSYAGLAQVVSGTTYSTPSVENLPTGWSGNDGGGNGYIKLIAAEHYIQTANFEQEGFVSITLKARKFGGPSATQAQISVSWYDAEDEETVLGTIDPTSTTLTNYTINSPAIPESGNGYVMIQCKGASASKGAGISEVTITYTEPGGVQPTTYTVTYNANATGISPVVDTYAEGANVTLRPANTFTYDGHLFSEWNTQADGDGDSYEPGDVIENIQDNIELYAIWTEVPADEQWVLTNLADLTTDDVFVIVGDDSYAMSNDNGTTSAPVPVAVTINGNNLTGTIAANIQWNITGNATDGYSFLPNGTTNYLFCNTNAATSSNNNLRVGNGGSYNRILFVLNNNNHLVTNDEYAARYVSIYNTQDWRGYTNENSAATMSFYKKVTAGAVPPSITAENVSIEYNAVAGAITYTINDGVEGGALTATTESDWLTLGEVGTTVPFTCLANEAGTARTATVTLTYTYNRATVTANVTVTQAGNPNATMTIAEVRAQGTGSVVTTGIVTSCVGTTGYIQDNTAAICVYGAELTVGDEIRVSGTLSTYKGLLEITSPEVTVLTNGNTVEPTLKTIAEINADDITSPNSIQGLYVTIEDATVTVINGSGSSQNTTIAQGTNTIVVRGALGVTVAVNDVITLNGNIGCYNVAQIANPQNVEVQVAPVVASITVTPATVNAPVEGAEGTLEVTYQNITEVVAEVYFCDAEGEEATYDWILAEIDDENNVYYLIDANDGDARTAYLKVYALDDNAEDVYSNLVTISQEAYVAPTFATLPFEFNGGRADIENADGLYQEGLGSDYNSAPKLKFDGTGDWLLLQFEGVPGELAFDIKGNSFSEGTFTVQTSEDGETYTDFATFTELGSTEHMTYNTLGEDVRYIKWIYTAKVNGNVALGNITLAEPAAPVATITVEPATVNATAEETEGTLTVTYENITEVVAEIYFCDAEGEEATYDWILAEIDDENNVYYLIDANEGEARTAYLKVYALDDNAEDVYSNLVTVTQAAPEIPFEGATYTLVNYIESGRHYIISNGTDRAMGGQNNNNRAAVEIAVEDGVAQVDSDDVVEFVINGPDVDGFYTIYDAAYPGYLYAAGASNSNYLRTQTFCDNKGQWTITFDEETNAATIVANFEGRNKMRYNSNNDIFSCYAGGQQDIYLFVKDEDETYEFFVDIKGYTAGANDTWYAISTPVNTDPVDVNHMLDETFDLYMFDPTAVGEEWQNYKVNNFSLTPGEGYLYANENDVTLRFAGTAEDLYDGTGDVDLMYYDDEEESLCWNLVGNPLSYAAYLVSDEFDVQDFFIMNGDGAEFELAERDMVNPFEAVFVKADYDGDFVYFYNDDINNGSGNSGGNVGDEKLNVRVSDENGKGDFARVRFGEGNNLEKFMLNPANTKLYFPMDDEDCAVVYANNMGEMPLNFSAAADGTYTLSINAENMEMEYLHLIDNMTGTDVDLLATPSYSFHARVNDNAARFTLVFASLTGMDENTADQFAFFSNGSFIVSNEGNAMLQVVDVTGRIVKSESINGTANVHVDAAPGVYMLRLVNGDNVKVQKVVVK